MRLTLRTLLAYLDDRLDPGNARELGQKISASPFARELAERIKGVVRKRRLASDDSGQKTIDANLIAEYLDDQLTPELVALIEKEILASDHSLAEVAATHQILGMLADPLEVDEKLRKRLHQMDPVAEAAAGGAMTEAEISASKDWKPLAPAASGSRRSPMLVLVLMVFGWLVLLFLDRNLYRQASDQPVAASNVDDSEKGDDAAKANGAAAEQAAAAAENLGKVNAEATDSADGQSARIAAVDGNGTVKPAPVSATVPEPLSESDQAIARAQALTNPQGVNEVVIPEPKLKPAPDDSVAQNSTSVPDGRGNPPIGINDPAMSDNAAGSDLTGNQPSLPDATVADVKDSRGLNGLNANGAAADVAMVDGSMPNEVKPEEPVSSVFSPHSFFVDDSSGALILSNVQKAIPSGAIDQQMDWMWASNLEGKNNWNNLLSMRVACIAAPFSTTVGCQASGWQIQAVGSSVFQGIDEKYAGLKVLSGRFILTRTVAAKPEPFLLEVGGRQLLLNPADTQQRVAITVRSLPTLDESSSEGDSSLMSKSAAVLVTFAAFGGPAKVKLIETEDEATIIAGDQMMFRTDANFTAKTVKQPMLQWEWVLAAANQIPEAQATLRTTLIKKLKVHDSVREAVAAVAEDGNPMIARWAVQIPMAERDVEQLVRLLFQSEQQVVRSEAFYSLQEISRTVAGGNSAVVAMLETRLNLSEMQQAMRMVEEISRISFEDRLASEWLVDMLNSDRLVLREMAISTLEQHLNNRNNFFADETKSRRERAVRRWKSELDRNDGRLIPPQE